MLKSIRPLSPGKYKFPFKFKMPDKVPPSCIYSLDSETKKAGCSCTYVLYCQILDYSGVIGREKWQIEVLQTPKPIVQEIKFDITRNIRIWCFCNYGTVDIRCVLEKDTIRMDEVVTLRINANLKQSKLGIKAMHIHVQRCLHLGKGNAIQKPRLDNILTVSVEGFPRGTVSQEDIVAELDMRQAAINDAPKDVLRTLEILGGRYIQQTVTGKLICWAYQLLIEVEMERKLLKKCKIQRVIPLHVIGSEI